MAPVSHTLPPIVNYSLPDPLGVIGDSRGTELALLAGTLFPRIGAVVAYAPSAVLWPGVGAGVAADTPAWTYRGQGLPFVPYRTTPAARATVVAGIGAGRGEAETPVFLGSLGDTAAVAAATIPVERIAGPILRIAGEDDQLWPSGTFAGLIADRLRQQGHPYPDLTLRYPAAGHLIGLPNLPTVGDLIRVPGANAALATGGTPAGNAAASADSWPRVLRFLAAALP